jgi:virulence-associated protein VagC
LSDAGVQRERPEVFNRSDISTNSFYATGEELSVQKFGNLLVITPRNDPWGFFKQSLRKFSEDFFKTAENSRTCRKRKPCSRKRIKPVFLLDTNWLGA